MGTGNILVSTELQQTSCKWPLSSARFVLTMGSSHPTPTSCRYSTQGLFCTVNCSRQRWGWTAALPNLWERRAKAACLAVTAEGIPVVNPKGRCNVSQHSMGETNREVSTTSLLQIKHVQHAIKNTVLNYFISTSHMTYARRKWHRIHLNLSAHLQLLISWTLCTCIC